MRGQGAPGQMDLSFPQFFCKLETPIKIKTARKQYHSKSKLLKEKNHNHSLLMCFVMNGIYPAMNTECLV